MGERGAPQKNRDEIKLCPAHKFNVLCSADDPTERKSCLDTPAVGPGKFISLHLSSVRARMRDNKWISKAGKRKSFEVPKAGLANSQQLQPQRWHSRLCKDLPGGSVKWQPCTPCREAGRLAAHFPLSFLSSKSSSRVLASALQQTTCFSFPPPRSRLQQITQNFPYKLTAFSWSLTASGTPWEATPLQPGKLSTDLHLFLHFSKSILQSYPQLCSRTHAKVSPQPQPLPPFPGGWADHGGTLLFPLSCDPRQHPHLAHPHFCQLPIPRTTFLSEPSVATPTGIPEEFPTKKHTTTTLS